MRLDKRSFIFNFNDLNNTYPTRIFKKRSRFKKTLKIVFDSWLAVIVIALMLLCSKIAAEDLVMYLLK